MAIDRKLVRDLEDSARQVEALKGLLNSLYYSTDTVEILGKPRVSLMVTGCDFLIQNLRQMIAEYQAQV